MDCEALEELLVNMCFVFSVLIVKEASVTDSVAWYSECEMLAHLMRWIYEGWNFNSGIYLFTTDTK